MQTTKKKSPFQHICLLSLAVLLASCSLGVGRPSSDSSSTNEEETASSSEISLTEDFSSSESIPSEEPSSYEGEAKTFRFYCVNDFHGSIVPTGYEVGLSSLFSFLKSKVDEDPDHTIVLSAGDMFQGSWESNSNRGHLIVDAMGAVPFSAMTLGNHDFDYGIDALQSLIDSAKFPTLAGNINYYGTETRWEHSLPSAMIEKDGVKIGIIGNIGQGQTTSIQARIVQDLDFVDPLPVIEKEAIALKNQGAQIVVNVLHDQATVMNTTAMNISLKDFIDGSFGGHNHQKEYQTYDGVPVVNGGYNGRGYSYFELTISEDGVVPSNAAAIAAPEDFPEDPAIRTIIDRYLDDDFNAKTNEILGTLTGGTIDKTAVARLGCKAIYEEYKSKYPDLVVTMENSQRAPLYSGEITYGKLYKATPFMNSIVFAKATGREIKAEASHNSTYTGDKETYATLNDGEMYTIGVIDYLYFHQDRHKNCNYFPSAANEENILGIENDFPVDITARYIKNRLGGTLISSSVSGTANGFDLYK